MTVAGNQSILLPIQVSAIADCRKGDVCFVCVTCNIDFTHFISIPTYGTSILRVRFYIKLPQMTVVQVNGAGANYNLTTWHMLECLTAAWKALSHANAKGTGTDDWVIRSLDD